jgi:hypothetical protein
MTETCIQPAPAELQALATAMRPDWDREALAAAILAAKHAGWTWDRTLAEVIRLARKETGSPVEMRHAAARPARAGEASPADGPAWAARAREMLAGRNDGSDAA